MHNTAFYDSPIGWMKIQSDGEYIIGAEFLNSEPKIKSEQDEITQQCIHELSEYFDGNRTAFEVPFKFYGTPFQEEVWSKLKKIPYGRTSSYKQLAKKMGSVKLSRAIGQTNSLNPIAVIVPCHRVIGSNGKLTGYAGGLERKKWLLEFEQKVKQPELF